ncbi:MAG: hypothetical protein COA44_13840 [Arcobacter sp.]|nr:MAG: hypothetical protein COA44_13840 [Arcobacter sp.]
MPLKRQYDTRDDYGEVWYFLKKNKIVISTKYLSKYVNEGFSPKTFEKFIHKIKDSKMQLFLITKAYSNEVVSSATTYLFARVAAVLHPEIITKYLKRQVKYCFSKNYISSKNLIEYMLKTLPYYNCVSTGRSYGFSLIKISDEVVSAYKNDENVIFKAIKEEATISISYKKKKISLSYKAIKNPKWKKTISSYKLFHNMLNETKLGTLNIEDRNNKYGLIGRTAVKVFSTFNPELLLARYRLSGWKYIKSNIPLVSLNLLVVEVHSLSGKKASSTATKYLNVMDDDFYSGLELLYIKLVKIQKRTLLWTNKNMLYTKSSVMKFVYRESSSKDVRSRHLKVNFSKLPLYNEFAEYMWYELKRCNRNELDFPSILNRLVKLLNFSVENRTGYSLFCASKLSSDMILDYMKSIESSRSTVESTLQSFRRFVNFLIKRKLSLKIGIIPSPPIKDVSAYIKTKVIKSHKNYQPIPEFVYLQIMNNIEDIEKSFKNAFILMSSCGLRPQDLPTITPDSIKIKNGKKELVVFMKKQNKAYTKKGMKPQRTIPIVNIEIEKAFYEQVEYSKVNRSISGMKSIFVIKTAINKIHDTRLGIMTSSQLGYAINNLIKKHNICAEDGHLWHYYSYQLRVKLVVDMLEAGSTDKELRALMGWLSETTCENAYAMAQKLKMKDLNVRFLNWEFQTSLPEDALDLYSEEERYLIFTELYKHKRNMGYGECVRHPIQGDCGKLQEANSCASCSKLIVGEKHRSIWEEYYHNQFKYIYEMRQANLNHGIESHKFERNARYKYEMGILESYASVLISLTTRRKEVSSHE